MACMPDKKNVSFILSLSSFLNVSAAQENCFEINLKLILSRDGI